jgi:selenocysteine-specific elongation factor
MPYIIGTAGHIDHGKTSLIKALTGFDTDRLKEEKERGISIDLGFAYLDLPDGSRAGIVDVPGHERFIRNMLAGAHGIDLVLFTVAADDGIMPQTEEHLDILHLLGIRMAIFLITKADIASPERIKEVEEDIRILTLGTALEDSPIVAFSSVTGLGLGEVKQKIFEMLQTANPQAGGGYFRLPVDRVFVLQGHGVVVTGTALSGRVAVADRVRCVPGGQLFRVRSLQVHNHPVETAGRGQRVALNLASQEKSSLERGHTICDEKITLATDRFDALLEVRPAAKKGIKNHQRVRLHLATAERLGKIILLGGKETAEPKQSVFCQVTLVEPLLALRNDRFIVRDETAQRTLAGGMVIHPWAKRHARKEQRLEDKLDELRSADVPRLIHGFLDENEAFAVSIESFFQFLNLTEEETRAWLERTPGLLTFSMEGEKIYATEQKWEQLKATVLTQLRDYHASHPLAPGMEMEELRVNLSQGIQPRLFRDVVELLAAQKVVARDGNVLRLPDYRVRLRDDERALTEKVKTALGSNPLAPPDLKQIEKDLGVTRAKLSEVVRVMERERMLVRVATDLYFLKSHVDKVKELLYIYFSTHGEITAATFRDLLGSSRKYAIGLLEYFDREGITARVGDTRKLRSPVPPGK